MTPSNLRIAAGAGVIAASLLVGPPDAAVAVADAGGSGSHSSQSDRENHSDRGDKGDDRRGPKQGSDERGSRGNQGNGSRQGEQNPQKKSDLPRSSVGSMPGITVNRVPVLPNQTAVFPGPQNLVPEISVPDLPVVDWPGGGSSPADSDPAGTVPVPAGPPLITVGNGRSSVIQIDQPDPPVPQSAAPLPAPQEPPAATAAAPADPAYRFSLPHLHLPGLPQLGASQADPTLNSLFGLAGLVLIPAAGAALGYRQARLAQVSGRP